MHFAKFQSNYQATLNNVSYVRFNHLYAPLIKLLKASGESRRKETNIKHKIILPTQNKTSTENSPSNLHDTRVDLTSILNITITPIMMI